MPKFNLGKVFKDTANFVDGLSFLSLVVGIATILAGVIGIGNILLISVKERTKEIQVMEVVGSRGGEPITKKKAFIDLWEIDADKKKYRTMGLYPKNCPKDVYNLWKGFDIEKLGKECKDDGDIKPFRDLLLALVGGKIEDREYVEKWLAHLFQFPEKQTPIALVFQGTGGEGKSKFWKFIGELMGVNTFCSTDEPEKDIFEKHSTLLEGKKLAVIEEMEQATHKKRMRQFGKVDIPQEAFISALKMDN